MTKLNARALRHTPPSALAEEKQKLTRNQVFLILEDIYDTYNIGGLFRLADALAVQRVYLCGETEKPPNTRIHKASCGTYKVVPWEYAPHTQDVLKQLKDAVSGLRTIAIEQSHTSIPYHAIAKGMPIALVVGNETRGISPQTLNMCDHIAEIPMWGVNKSLNVIVSAAIVSYHLMTQ